MRIMTCRMQLALTWLVTRGPSLAKTVIDGHTYKPPAGSCPSFAWITSTMGSGKTIVALHSALYTIGHGWGEVHSKLGEWGNRPVNNDRVRYPHPLSYPHPLRGIP